MKKTKKEKKRRKIKKKKQTNKKKVMGMGEHTWLGYIMSRIAVCGSEQGQKFGHSPVISMCD